jgi:putative alpha-1,2-mannosidase
VKLGPDLTRDPPTDAYSGFLPTGNFTGFSMMHESGTGGAPKYGVVSQMPVAAEITNPLLNITAPRAAEDAASVGYYKAQLQAGATNATNITVELAGTNHAAMYQYTFPSDAKSVSVVVDVSHVLESYRGLGWGQHYTGGKCEIFADGHYEGYGSYDGGWNLC